MHSRCQQAHRFIDCFSTPEKLKPTCLQTSKPRKEWADSPNGTQERPRNWRHWPPLRAVGQNTKIPVKLLEFVTGPSRWSPLLCPRDRIPHICNSSWGRWIQKLDLTNQAQSRPVVKIPHWKQQVYVKRTRFTVGILFPLCPPHVPFSVTWRREGTLSTQEMC